MSGPALPLAELGEGRLACVAEVLRTADDDPYPALAEELGLAPGVRLRRIGPAPEEGVVRFEVEGGELGLSAEMIERVRVRPCG